MVDDDDDDVSSSSLFVESIFRLSTHSHNQSPPPSFCDITGLSYSLHQDNVIINYFVIFDDWLMLT